MIIIINLEGVRFMKKIDKEEMMSVEGGFFWSWTIGKIVAAVLGTTFVTGVIDGFIRPLRCN